MASDKTADNPRLDAAIARVTDISTIQVALLRVMRVVNDPKASALDLAEVIGTDPALTARIVRTVNSAAYGLRAKVRHLWDAVVQLGFRRVRNLAMAATVCDLFRAKHRLGAYDRERLWQHMVGVGVGARAMASACGRMDADEAFLAGLLHDIGIILEDQYVHDDFTRGILKADPGEGLRETERRHLGFDHTELGDRIARAWRFPDAVVDAIAFHHEPEAYEGPAKEVVCAVAAADWICGQCGVPAVDMPDAVPPSERVLEPLGFDEQDLAVYGQDIQSELAGVDDLLAVC